MPDGEPNDKSLAYLPANDDNEIKRNKMGKNLFNQYRLRIPADEFKKKAGRCRVELVDFMVLDLVLIVRIYKRG